MTVIQHHTLMIMTTIMMQIAMNMTTIAITLNEFVVLIDRVM